MQGVLNFYQLDLEGNQTTVIDDLVNQQAEEYEQIAPIFEEEIE